MSTNEKHATKPRIVDITFGDYAGSRAKVMQEALMPEAGGRLVPHYIVELSPGVSAFVRQSYVGKKHFCATPK